MYVCIYIVIPICFELQKVSAFYFSNHEGSYEFLYGACRVGFSSSSKVKNHSRVINKDSVYPLQLEVYKKTNFLASQFTSFLDKSFGYSSACMLKKNEKKNQSSYPKRTLSNHTW